MAIQLPLIATYLAVADWRQRSATYWLGAQLLGVVVAATPVFLRGY